MEDAHGIVIVGAGICGLATALALHRKGIPSLVLERSEALRADGVALAVQNNGWRALDQLGVAAELRETANLITTYHYVWLPGNKSATVPVRKEVRGLKRKDLIETLAKNIPAGAIRFGCRIVAVHEDPATHGSVLTAVDGSTIRAKVLIGCDGTNSVVAKYLGLSAPKTIPLMVLRGFTRSTHGHPGTESLLLIGQDFYFGRLPITDNLAHFFVTMPNASTVPDPGITTDVNAVKDLVLEKLQDQCPAEITAIVRDSDPESLNFVAKMWYRPPWQVALAGFRRGAVTVAGDAMHVMCPFIGQGAAAGLEDAVVLARALSRAGREQAEEAIAAAIRAYVRERRLRVLRLSLESYVAGALPSASSLIGRLACTAILALLGNRSHRHANFDCGRL